METSSDSLKLYKEGGQQFRETISQSTAVHPENTIGALGCRKKKKSRFFLLKFSW
jgi:hypothetical protein